MMRHECWSLCACQSRPSGRLLETYGDGTEFVIGRVQTRVTVEHFGWDRIPPQSAARHGFPVGMLQLRFAQ